jgi:predicted Co/Zn/Cd cation transporter (cation efflux family)
MALTQQDRIETRALTLGAFGNIGMAVVAWLTYWFSNSEAILLDGNYSFIIFLGMGVALSISRVKAKRTDTFPLGQFFYEALYSFVKGLMIFGVILMAVVTSIARILFYMAGKTENIPMLNPDPILFYALSMGVVCFSLSAFYQYANRSIGYQSSLLKTDSKASFVDGVLSLGIAAGVLLLRNTSTTGAAGFVPFLADSIITLILSASLIGKPLEIVRDAVIELALGTLQNKEEAQDIETTIRTVCESAFVVDRIYLSKTGSRYLAITMVRPDKSDSLSMAAIKKCKEDIASRFNDKYPHLMVHLLPKTH